MIAIAAPTDADAAPAPIASASAAAPASASIFESSFASTSTLFAVTLLDETAASVVLAIWFFEKEPDIEMEIPSAIPPDIEPLMPTVNTSMKPFDVA